MSRYHWAINGRFMGQRLTGVQRYAREIVSAMNILLTEDAGIADRLRATLALPPGAPVPESLGGDADLVEGRTPSRMAIGVSRTRFGRGHAWDQIVLPSLAPNILSLCNSGPLAARRHILCLHDLNVYLTPESYSRNYRALYRVMLPLAARRASRIVTVSQSSARLIAERGLCRADKITVIPNGSDHALRWDPARADRAVLGPLKRPYVVLLGSQALHKNIGLVLGLAGELDALGIDIAVVGGSDKVFAAAGHGTLSAGRNVHRLGGVDDDTLAALLGGALCLAFPSLVEGFGLPIVEAMALGCPVVSSNTTSMPEVGGDAALYAGPRDAAGWLAAIARLAGDPSLRNELAERGRLQARSFQWRDSAARYLALMKNVGSG